MPRSLVNKPNLAKHRKPIGVFDSGLGGLTVIREIRRSLPAEKIIYFGDLARLPYGIKSKQQILNFSIQNTRLLKRENVKAIVVACNSSASAAYKSLKSRYVLPFIDVIEPAVESALKKTKKKRVGIIATQATIESHAYQTALRKRDKKVKVFVKACPLLVPLVEEGLIHHDITDKVLRKYLEKLKKQKIDTLILGCTHYPLLKDRIQRIVGKSVSLIDSAKPTVKKLAALLNQKGLLNSSRGTGSLKVLISDKPRNFKLVGEKFLGEKIKSVRIVRI